MSDYIALDKIEEKIAEMQSLAIYEDSFETLRDVRTAIETLAAADVRPIIKAHWHDVYMTGPCSWAGTCSHCGQANDIPPPRNAHYCPNCGAQMSEVST